LSLHEVKKGWELIVMKDNEAEFRATSRLGTFNEAILERAECRVTLIPTDWFKIQESSVFLKVRFCDSVFGMLVPHVNIKEFGLSPQSHY